MKNNNIYKDRYIPFNLEEEDDVLNTLYDYIRRFGIKVDKKDNRVLNPRHIIISKSQIRINRSFFKADIPLLGALEKLPKEGTEDILRMVFDALLFRDLGKKGYIEELKNKDFILIDDLDSVEDNSKV